ncbi:MAG: ATP-binding protein, partial [Candidatus Methanomethylophilaceae archaeon]|nr:ATP-binding protein [Candidatus Methanomethylophilaceae archaeon]
MKEDAHTEFKESFTNKIVKAAVAFSNESGGTIYVGIKDDGEIIGVDNQDVESNRIISSLLDNVRPSINGSFSLETVDMYGKDVIRVTISEGSNKPYYWKEKGL